MRIDMLFMLYNLVFGLERSKSPCIQSSESRFLENFIQKLNLGKDRRG